MKTVASPEDASKAIAGIREAAAKGAQIVCLQELFRSQYFCQTEDHRCFDLAEPVPGPSTERLSTLAGELGVVIVASLFEKRADRALIIVSHDSNYIRQHCQRACVLAGGKLLSFERVDDAFAFYDAQAAQVTAAA